MVFSMRDSVIGDCEVVDGNVASKAGDVGDNGGMTCGEEVLGWHGILRWYESLGVVWNNRVVWKSRGWCGILVWYGSIGGWCCKTQVNLNFSKKLQNDKLSLRYRLQTLKFLDLS